MRGDTGEPCAGAGASLALAPEAVRKNLGVYAKPAPEAAARLPQAKLVMFDDLGHAPQIQDPARFHRALLESLTR